MQKYLKLKEKAESLRRDSDRAAAAEEFQRKRLLDEFGCKSVKEAEAKLKKLQKELEDGEAEFEKVTTEFEKAWQKQFEGDGHEQQ